MSGDFHAHTAFCDGKNTVAEMCAAAYEKGLSAFGLSGHCFTPFDTSYCMSEEDTGAYIAAVNAEKARYAGRMDVLLGVEADIFGALDKSRFDYVISSVHYFDLEGFPAVDHTEAILRGTAERFFGGDLAPLCKLYYREVAGITDGIVGHFDLITKFGAFDEQRPDYKDAALTAADALLDRGLVFEVNTGAMSRGYLSRPYPARFILERIFERGGGVILSSDAHSADAICAHFDTARELLRDVGFKSTLTLTPHGFEETPL